MAWSDQCKFAFKANAEAIFLKQKGRRSISKVCRELATDTGIPIATLRRWWRDMELLKNEQNEENLTSTESTVCQSSAQSAQKLCIKCGEKPIYINPARGGPCRKNSRYFGLCGGCRAKLQRIIRAQKPEGAENISKIVCPICGAMFDINADNLKSEGEGK